MGRHRTGAAVTMTTPTADALSQVTIDTSLLYPSTARRFLMTLWDMQALKIPVLPRTSRELHGVIKEQEAREIIEGGKSIARDTEQRRVSATRLAAREAGYER